MGHTATQDPTMAIINDFGTLSAAKGLKLVHLNIRSLVKKVDKLRLILKENLVDVFTISETWLQPHLNSGLVEIDGYRIFRMDRKAGGGNKKRGGGLLTYVNAKFSSQCEALEDLDASDPNIEAQRIYIHRPNCKDAVVCNIYLPPSGDLNKAISY